MGDFTTLTSLLREHETALWWIGASSAVAFVGSLIIVPWLVVRIPSSYFLKEHRPRTPFAAAHPALRWLALIVKNFLGGTLVLAGLAMLLLPGQGLLTIVIGVMLLDFPGKLKLEARIVRRPAISRAINWLRSRAGVEPLQFQDSQQ